MDGHRRYADEPEKPSWYSGQSTPGGRSQHASPYDTGSMERPSGAFRLPAEEPLDVYDEVTSTGTHSRSSFEPARTSVRGPEYPAVRPNQTYGTPAAAPPPEPAPAPPAVATAYNAPQAVAAGYNTPQAVATGYEAPQAVATGYNEPTSMVPAVPPAPERQRDSVYSRRRPISAIVVAAVTVLLMVPVVRLLAAASFAGDPSARAIIPAVLLTLGLPLTGAGLYALAAGGRPHNIETWLRPPVAYLPTGLFLVLAAALAVA